MKGAMIFSGLVLMALTQPGMAQGALEPRVDKFDFGAEQLTVNLYGHAALMLNYQGLNIYVDPVSQHADYAHLPKADIILITHEHGDHLDSAAIAKIQTPKTEIVTNQNSAAILKEGRALKNGDKLDLLGIQIEAVPAYNTTPDRFKFHPKGRDNGFVLTLGTARVYIAGDTEDIPELENLKKIDIAFLPANQPYTMNEPQLVHAAQMIMPKVLYPYHLGNTDVVSLEKALKKIQGIDVRFRDMN